MTQGKITKTETRKFLGVFPPQNTFDKAHLKAYLKGHKYFNHGFVTNVFGKRERQAHIVLES